MVNANVVSVYLANFLLVHDLLQILIGFLYGFEGIAPCDWSGWKTNAKESYKEQTGI